MKKNPLHHRPTVSRPRRFLMLLVWLASSGVWSAVSQEALELDIPAGPMGGTLLEIARRAETIVSFHPAAVAGLTAPAIQGRMTVEQALSRATACCGLVVRGTSGGILTVVVAVPEGAAPPVASAPASAAPAAARLVQSVLPPVEIIASPRQAEGLRPVRGWAATRTDTPLAELPQAVSVLTPEALALQGGNTVVESMRFVSGVTGVLDNAGSGGFGSPSLLVRGLNAAYALSGLRSVSGDVPAELTFVERIEVPKGPSAVLTNVVDARGRGGVVNMVLKEAGPLTGLSAVQSISSRNHGSLRMASDLGGEWGDDAYWRVLAYATQSGVTDGGYDRQGSLGAMATSSVRRGALSASLTLLSDQRRDVPAPASRGGVTLIGGKPVAAPVELGQIDPVDPSDRTTSASYIAQLRMRWEISPAWSLSLMSMTERRDGNMQRHQPLTRPLNQEGDSWNTNGQLSLTGKFHTGLAEHTVLLGVDADRWRSDLGGVEIGDPTGPVSLNVSQRKQGVLLQEQMALGPLRLRLAAQRARIPAYELVVIPAAGPSRARTVDQLLATNWDGGLLYQWSPELAVYSGFQYSIESDLGRRTGSLPDGSPIPDASVHQLQLGLKGQWLDRRVYWTAEAFRIRQANIATLGGNGSRTDGRSVNGLEFELTGRPLTRLDLSLGLTLMEASDTIIAPGQAPALLRAAGVPRREFHVLGRYALSDSATAKSGLGLGLSATSSTLVGTPEAGPTTVQLPGSVQLDLSWDRSFGPWGLQANVRNVLNRQLYSTATDIRYIPLLPARSVGVAISYKD